MLFYKVLYKYKSVIMYFFKMTQSFIFLLVALSLSGYAYGSSPTTTPAPITHSITLCGSSRCYDISACEPAANWTRREVSPLEELAFNNSEFPHSVNFGYIANITVPNGIKVELCEPDFTENTLQTCLPKTIHTLQCTSTPCVLAAPSARYQLFRFSFLANYGCFQNEDIAQADKHRMMLSSADNPNYIFECNQDEIVQDMTCFHACRETLVDGEKVMVAFNALQTQCSTQQKFRQQSQECLNLAEPLFFCEECATLPGQKNTGPALQCTYEDCLPGTYSSATMHTCETCPVHNVSAVGQSSCDFCPLGETSNDAHTACINCFSNFDSLTTTMECPAGSYGSVFISSALTFFFNLISDVSVEFTSSMYETLIRKACVQTYVCMPCTPGHYFDVSTQTCTQCQFGTFQPNYGRTECYDCHPTTSTLALGSVNNDACLCLEGFEPE